MYLIGSIVFITILIFLRLFYSSFILGEDIYLYFYKANSLGFIVLFYIFLLATLSLMIQKIRLSFIVVNLLFSTSLLIAGEYTYSLFLQFLFLFVLFENEKIFLKTLFLSVYLLALNKALLLLFSNSYPLYFIDLALLVYTLSLKVEILENFRELKIMIILIILVSVTYLFMQDFVFDFTIWLDIIDKQNYQLNTVIYVLSLVHLLIFMALRREHFKLD